MEKVYIKPTVIRGGRQGVTEKLYALESQRNNNILAAAKEWGRLNSIPQGEFWTRSLPQQLFDLLGSFDRSASKVAAEAYLEHMAR